jgi:uncharacterized tellurite resistance protein B-like protein
MFVHHLNPDQQAALLHYAYKVMSVDGASNAVEREHYNLLRSQASGVTPEEVPPEELKSLFDSRESRIVMLLELEGLCLMDGEIAPEEAHWIDEIASALGIGEDEVRTIRLWVERKDDLVKEACGMMEGMLVEAP